MEAVLEVVRGALEAAVLDETLDELVLGVEVVLELDLLPGEEGAGLDRHQGRCDHEELARHLDVEVLERADVVHVRVRHVREPHVLDLDLLLLDEVQEQIEGALEDLVEADGEVVLAAAFGTGVRGPLPLFPGLLLGVRLGHVLCRLHRASSPHGRRSTGPPSPGQRRDRPSGRTTIPGSPGSERPRRIRGRGPRTPGP